MEKEEMIIDRLSTLPDIIIHNILSFLDLKQAVQTCVLGKRWTNLWTSIPNLRFEGNDFNHTTFSTFINKVLSNRKDCDVCTFGFFSDLVLDGSLLRSVIEYAASHNVKHFNFLHSMFFFDSLWLFCKLLQCKSVETLSLSFVPFADLPFNFTFSFSLLTTLSLGFCSFSYQAYYLAAADPFAGCPNLKHLSLENCKFPSLIDPQTLPSLLSTATSESTLVVDVLKISGPQLVSLLISSFEVCSASKNNNNLRIEISAPRLEYLHYADLRGVYFYGHDLCSLKSANIHVRLPNGFRELGTLAEKEKFASDLIKMFNGIHNAQSMKLAPPTIEALNLAPGLLENQPSPFKRLESLEVTSKNDSFVMPAHVEKWWFTSYPIWIFGGGRLINNSQQSFSNN